MNRVNRIYEQTKALEAAASKLRLQLQFKPGLLGPSTAADSVILNDTTIYIGPVAFSHAEFAELVEWWQTLTEVRE